MQPSAHDVFISYSTVDRAAADAICAALEVDGLTCWIAPRDGQPGVSYAHFLVDAIAASRIVVLVYSRAANDSDAVLNELELASSRSLPILSIRIEKLDPYAGAEFYLRRRHWLDAFEDFAGALTMLPGAVRNVLAPKRTTGGAPRRQRNLPRMGTSFIGRSDDLARVVALLGEGPLVTIVGPGGVGKTRLALAAAMERDDLGDDVWFVDLSPISDPALIASTILTTIGATDGGEHPPIEALVRTIGQRNVGLVFDNCEHVVAEAARIASAILNACPAATILATSRESLNLAGERVYRLQPFDTKTAVKLFCERATASNPLFELSPSSAATVESICKRLDGLALAIELAAARVRVISIDELARRLNERFRILTGGNRTALPHQQTLRALIDWSYDLLGDSEAALFRRASAFGGTFMLDAVTDVAGFDPIDPWEALDLLSSLVDKSLVVAEIDEAGQRYHMLQSIHDYARDRLVEGESQDVARRHAEFFAGLAATAYLEWDTAPRADWLPRMRVELDNLRVALTWSVDEAHDPALGARLAGDSSPVFLRLALLAEGVSWCEKALANAATLPSNVEARLRYGMSMLNNNRVALTAATADVHRAVERYRASDDTRGLVRALSQLAQQIARQGNYEDAVALATEAIAGARELGEARLIASTLQRCGIIYRPEELERARADYAECVAIFRTLGRDYETANALNWWAIAEIGAGEFERGIELSLEALRLATGDLRLYALNNVAASALAIADIERGGPAAREVLQLACESNNAAVLANAISYLAAIAAPSDLAAAAQLFGYSQARLADLGWKPDNTDELRIDRLLSELRGAYDEQKLASLFAQGAELDDQHALALAQTI